MLTMPGLESETDVTRYPKINTIFKRNDKHDIVMWEWSNSYFHMLCDVPWVGKEKLDGENIRIVKNPLIWGDDKLGNFASRNKDGKIPELVSNRLRNIYMKLEASNLPQETILYGEAVGNGIRKGHQYIKEAQDFVLFDVRIGYNWQNTENVASIADTLGTRCAPVLDCLNLTRWVYAIQNGEFDESKLYPGAKNEGVVLTPMLELFDRGHKRIITKLKHEDFFVKG